MSNVEAIKKALEGVDLSNVDQTTNERVWLGCGNEDGEHASWFDPGEGGTPYIRADLVSTTLEALQRENEEQKAWIKTATLEITKAIGGGSEMFTQHGDDFRVDPAFVASFIQFRRERHAEAQKASVQKVKKLREALEPFATVSEKWVEDGGWTELACKNDRIVDWFGATDFLRARQALASAGE